MTTLAKARGDHGESIAASYLTSKKYRILQKNFRTRFGEIDLIALTPSSELVFVEVKTRPTSSSHSGIEAITPSKLTKIIHAAEEYLTENSYPSSTLWQIDVIIVTYSHKSSYQVQTHLENVSLPEF